MYVYLYTDTVLFMVLAISCANYWSALPGAKIPRSKDAAGSTYVMCGTIGYTVGPIDHFPMCFGPVSYINIYTLAVIERRI